MSRKIIQLGYLVPNTDRHVTAFEEVLKYFVDKGCLAKEGLMGFKLSSDLYFYKVDIDNSFLSPKRLWVELQGKRFLYSEDDKDDSRMKYYDNLHEVRCCFRVEYKLKETFAAKIIGPLHSDSSYVQRELKSFIPMCRHFDMITMDGLDRFD